MQNFLRDGARFRREFPGVPEIERAAAIVAIKSGALAAEKCALGMFGIFEPAPASETNMQFGEQSGEFDGPYAEVRDHFPDGGGPGRAEVFENRCNQTEILLARFGGGQQLLGNLGHKIESAGGSEIVQ